MITLRIYLFAFALLTGSICKAQYWNLTGNTTWDSVHYVGIGCSHSDYPLTVAGDALFTGGVFTNNLSVANSFNVGSIHVVNGVVDSIVSTSGALELTAGIVNAVGNFSSQTISSVRTMAAGGGSTKITINGDTGTIYSPGNKISFLSDTLVTTGAMKAGTMAVGTTYIPSGYALAVNGALIATDVYVELFSSWPDYVYEKNYNLRSLKDLENYLNVNHHLPGLPSAAEMKEKGSIPLGEVVTQNTKEIEELTLYIIELDKKVTALEEENKKLVKELKKN
jgi:hypothetical protein